MRFSRRTPVDLVENPLARALRVRPEPPLDLTESNPTRTGLSPSDDEIRTALSRAAAGSYRPDPRGLTSAREAVAQRYAGWGVEISPDRILLTASTSEAYAFLFKLLGDPGDTMLAPEPGYPLLDHLLRLDGLSAVAYDLRSSLPDGRWRIDSASVERGLDAGARALLLVHPNNPTGNFVKDEEIRRLRGLLDPSRHALVSDEVFLEFPVEEAPEKASVAAAAREGPLVFSLGGLSKSCALPQMKLAWIAIGGDSALAGDAIRRLELIADTYLSLGTPVQLALPDLFAIGAGAAERTRRRLHRNLAALDRMLSGLRGASRYPVEGGWSAVARLPWKSEDGDLALYLLENAGVLVHPGWFFDLGEDDAVVLSLIADPGVFEEGLAGIGSALGSRQ